MPHPTGPPARVLIAGAGVAGLETALALRAFAPGLADVELLEPRAELTLAAESTAQPFGPIPRGFPLAPLAERARVRLRGGRLQQVRPEEGIALTDRDEAVGYDRLVIAIGARALPVLQGAVSFAGPADVAALRRLLGRIVRGARGGLRTRLAFVVPPGASWPLPAYELALQTARHLTRRGVRENVRVLLVTSEDAPLALFGASACEAVAADLARAGIATWTGSRVLDWSWGRLTLAPRGTPAVDRVVAIPALRGPAIAGLPCDERGFVRARADGRVVGAPGVFVVGDAGPFPVKQGGLACQQADAVASLIARGLGADVDRIPFEPVLRGWLWDGDQGRFLRSDLSERRDERAGVTSRGRPVWSPVEKVACRFLTALLEDGPGSARRRARAVAPEAPAP